MNGSDVTTNFEDLSNLAALASAPAGRTCPRPQANGEIARLELALMTARKRLLSFEDKYGVTSDHFIAALAAEDLEGKDDEYVQGVGILRRTSE